MASAVSTSSHDDDGSLDLSADAPLPEETSPYDAAAEDPPLLYVQIIDVEQAPRPGLAYQVSGTGLSEVRSGVTDAQGELLIEDCGAGVYELVVDGQTTLVHTLSRRDLEDDPAPYRVLL